MVTNFSYLLSMLRCAVVEGIDKIVWVALLAACIGCCVLAAGMATIPQGQ